MRKAMIAGALLLSLCSASVQGQTAQSQKPLKQKVQTTVSTDKYKVETNKFWNNWFVSVGGGGLIYFGDFDREVGIGKRISPALNINVGKWFTPGIGVRLGYDGLSQKGATKDWDGQSMTHATNDQYPGRHEGGPVWGQKFNFAQIHGDVLFNMSNLLCGYNEKRIWSVTPYVGIGWIRVWQAPQAKEVGASLGLINNFRLCSALDLQLDVRGVMANDRLDGECYSEGRDQDGYLSATLNLVYKFPKRGWDRSKTTTITYDENEIRERLKYMANENQRLRDQLTEAAKREPEKVADTKFVIPDCIVTFAIGKSTLDHEDRVNLGFQAKLMKEDGNNATYVIHGYADKGTGTVARNAQLSRERAQAVFNCLTKEFGVSPSRLKMVDEGGVANMFYNDPRMSRAVVTRATK